MAVDKKNPRIYIMLEEGLRERLDTVLKDQADITGFEVKINQYINKIVREDVQEREHKIHERDKKRKQRAKQ